MIIVALLKAGIPQTASYRPCRSFDLSDQQLNAIATWIHYARAQGRFKELTEGKDPPPGNADAGKATLTRNAVHVILHPAIWQAWAESTAARC